MAEDIANVFKSLNYRPTKEEYQSALNFFSEERAQVRKLIEKLNWNEDPQEQQNAIKRLADELLPCEYIYLVLPDQCTVVSTGKQTQYYKQGTDKDRWENAAKTIIRIGWPKVDNIIIPLFVWLIDPNWPGSQLIYDLVLSLPRDVLFDKMREILDNPQNYHISDYEDLKDAIEDIKTDLQKGHAGTALLSPPGKTE